MALAGIGVLADALFALPKTMSKADGVKNFVDKIGDYMDELQAGPTGSPGIFKLNRPVMVAQLMSVTPVNDKSWVSKLSNAWAAGVAQATITPGTVTVPPPTWIGSGNVDSETLPIGASTITTIPAGKDIMDGILMTATPTMKSPIIIARAVHNATIALSFTCIGKSLLMVDVPLPFLAQ
jgi:hypothetical protein